MNSTHRMVVPVGLTRRLGSRHEAAPYATTFDQVPALTVPGFFRRALIIAGDVLGAVAIVLCIPFAILAIGMPIALCVRLLLWIGRLL